MTPIGMTLRKYGTEFFLCILLLLVFIVAELAISELFSSMFARIGLFWASLLDASILVLFYAFPLGFFIFQPFLLRTQMEKLQLRPRLIRLFLESLAAIFLTQFLVMLLIGIALADLDTNIRNGLDAVLTLLIFAFFFQRIYFYPEIRKQRAILLESLSSPLHLYGLLLLIVFLADLLESKLMFFYLPEPKLLSLEVLDSFLFTTLAAPLLWLVLMRPLKHFALVEKTFCEAMKAQVVDAIITINAEGLIQSTNPAAERIFGYESPELIGRSTNVLLPDNGELLDAMGNNDVAPHVGGLHWEMTGRHRDGSVVYLDVSLSRVLLGGEEWFLLILRDVGARKLMDEALRTSEERFRIIVSGGNEGIWDCDLVSGSFFYTTRFAELLGYREDELEHDFGTLESLLHPDDHDGIMQEVNDHLLNRDSFNSECRLRTRSGNYLWFGVRGQAVWDASGRPVRLAGSISNISSRKDAEQALQDSALRFRQIFEQVEDAILFLKPGTCSIIDLNPAAEKLFGYDKGELFEKGLPLVCIPDQLTRVCKGISRICHGEVLSLDNITNRRKDGTAIVVSIRGKIMTLQGIDIIYCSFRDVTARVNMEIEARHIQSKLIQANKMTSLGLLVSGVAHEINNPNNYILTNTQLLSMVWEDAVKLLHEYQRENGEFYLGGLPFTEIASRSPQIFADIVDGTRRINEIISNLKSFARQEQTDLDQVVNINQVVKTAVSILHHEIVKYTKNFNLELSEAVQPVIGSSQQLGQVMINLITNACQALPDKKRAIWVTTDFDSEACQVTITVRDEGVGMPSDVCSRILEPFFTTKVDIGGTGLGLSISQSIIKDHNGLLKFASEPGKGTTFVVKIPCAKTAEKEGTFETRG